MLGYFALAAGALVAYHFSTLRAYGAKKYQQLRTLQSLLAQMSNTPDTEYKFEVAESGKCVIVTFVTSGRSYTVTVPYAREHVARMTSTEVRGWYKDGTSIVLRQYPGVPFIVSVGDMGFERLEIVDFEEGDTQVFNRDDIPLYGK